MWGMSVFVADEEILSVGGTTHGLLVYGITWYHSNSWPLNIFSWTDCGGEGLVRGSQYG